MPHPPDKPDSQARYNIRNPGALQHIEDIVVPEPHIREDADERGYLGVFQGAEDASETQTQYIRLPVDVMHLIYQIVNNPEEVYAGNAAAFCRHAVYELLFAHFERRKGRREAPQIVQYLRQIELAREQTWEMHAVRGLKEFLRGMSMFLAQAIEHKNVMDVHRKLDGFNRLLLQSTSDTWSAQFRSLLRADPVITKAVNLLVDKWTDSEDSWKRTQQENWSSWLQGLREE